jgi:hypothetical protein
MQTALTEDQLIELASEVVRVAYEQGLTLSMATMSVMVARNTGFGQATDVLSLAQKVVNENPAIAEELPKHRKHRGLPPGFESHVSRTAQAQADVEDRAEALLPPLPRYQVLGNGQYVFWDLVPTVLNG